MDDAWAAETRPAAVATTEAAEPKPSDPVPAHHPAYLALHMLSGLGFNVRYVRGCFGENTVTRREMAEIARDLYAQYTGSLQPGNTAPERLRTLLSRPTGRAGVLLWLQQVTGTAAPELRAMGGPAALIPEQVRRAAEESVASLRR